MALLLEQDRWVRQRKVSGEFMMWNNTLWTAQVVLCCRGYWRRKPGDRHPLRENKRFLGLSNFDLQPVSYLEANLSIHPFISYDAYFYSHQSRCICWGVTVPPLSNTYLRLYKCMCLLVCVHLVLYIRTQTHTTVKCHININTGWKGHRC